MKGTISSAIIAVCALFVLPAAVQAQCTNWVGSPRMDEATDAHSVYRTYLKDKQEADVAALDEATFKIAFDNWNKAYTIAPAADGKRATHYLDGLLLYKAKLSKATDDAAKKEAGLMLEKLYDQLGECYPEQKAFALGRKGFDMFYYLGYGFTKPTYETLMKAIEVGGNKTEYIVFDPMAQVAKYLFKTKQITKEDARTVFDKLTAISEHNVANNKTYGQYYKDVKAIMDGHFKEIETEIFDCDFFKAKLLPEFKANPDNMEVISYVYATLKARGCSEEDSDLKELKVKYEVLADSINKVKEAEFLANNPAAAAKKLSDEGKYSEAIEKLQEAIAKETDNSSKADLYLSMATIQYRRLKSYGAARENARRAASLKGGWGAPYILIGDMYAASSASCGSDQYERGLAVIAAIDKYAYARSIDSSVASDASERIGRMSASLPEKGDAFSRGVIGKTATVPCWIGETVTVRTN